MVRVAILLWLFGNVLGVSTNAQNAMTPPSNNGYFKLKYIYAGLGSNLFESQPKLEIDGMKFTYTVGEAWIFPGSEKTKPDTIVTGIVRKASIDPIIKLIALMKDSTIKRINPYIASGGLVFLDVFTNDNSVCFYLDNSYDSIADKIVAILNIYVPAGCRKLIISEPKRKKSIVHSGR